MSGPSLLLLLLLLAERTAAARRCAAAAARLGSAAAAANWSDMASSDAGRGRPEAAPFFSKCDRAKEAG